MNAYAAKMYQKVDSQTSKPVQVLDKLYGRMLRDFADAKKAIEGEQIANKAEALGHALAIVAELRAALDYEVAPDLCNNLAALYGYIEHRIGLASSNLDIDALDQAAQVVIELRSAFSEAAESLEG